MQARRRARARRLAAAAAAAAPPLYLQKRASTSRWHAESEIYL
jgi:hypothetical protein